MMYLVIAMLKKTITRLIILLVVLLLVAGTFQYMRPVNALEPVAAKPTASTPSVPAQMAWPAYGQAAIGADGFGLLETHGTQTPVPIASITKVITSLAILDKYPIKEGTGPLITLTDNDVKLYNDYLAKDGSVTRVVAGEQISEYEALQAILLPSANNMADSLAIWAYGSIDSYLAYANQMLGKMGLTQTKVADASGFSPQSVSTASDLIKLGRAALDNKTLAEIVSQRQANIAVAGNIDNVNYLLGNSGVIGIKTGNTDQAGGCYLFAAEKEIDGQTIKIIGSVLGAPNLGVAINDSLPLLDTASKNFETKVIAKKGQVFGSLSPPWSKSVDAVSSKDVSLIIWKGQQPKTSVELESINAPAAEGSSAGLLKVSSNQKATTSTLVLKDAVPRPPILWKILRN